MAVWLLPRMGAPTVFLNLERIRSGLENGGFWKEIIVKDEVDSTNDLLKELAEDGAPEGTVIIAGRQRAGRGRRGRFWFSPKGGAWFSFLLRPPLSPRLANCVSLLISVAVVDSLGEWLDLPVKVKWPNDLILNNKKLGGILIELAAKAGKIDWLIAGMGINVNNPLPRNTRVAPTSLKAELGREVSLEKLFSMILNGVEIAYLSSLKNDFSPITRRWGELEIALDEIIEEGDQFVSHSYLESAMGG